MNDTDTYDARHRVKYHPRADRDPPHDALRGETP